MIHFGLEDEEMKDITNCKICIKNYYLYVFILSFFFHSILLVILLTNQTNCVFHAINERKLTTIRILVIKIITFYLLSFPIKKQTRSSTLLQGLFHLESLLAPKYSPPLQNTALPKGLL